MESEREIIADDQASSPERSTLPSCMLWRPWSLASGLFKRLSEAPGSGHSELHAALMQVFETEEKTFVGHEIYTKLYVPDEFPKH